jgi:hypothetical protein
LINTVKSISEVVQGFVKSWSRSNRIKTGLALYYWPKVIGDDLKTKTEAVMMKNGTLWVKTPDPTLAYNLTFFKKEIIKKYNKYLGPGIIRTVRVMIGDITQDYDFAKKEEIKTANNIQIPPKISEKMEEIRDPELKQVFMNFYKRHESIKNR